MIDLIYFLLGVLLGTYSLGVVSVLIGFFAAGMMKK